MLHDFYFDYILMALLSRRAISFKVSYFQKIEFSKLFYRNFPQNRFSNCSKWVFKFVHFKPEKNVGYHNIQHKTEAVLEVFWLLC